MELSLDSCATEPLVDQITRGLERLIDERVLRPGARLPSIRQFAKDHGVSRFTVVQAYDRLVAAGFAESRRGSGFYVSQRQPPERQASACQLDSAMDVLWLVRNSTQAYAMKHLPGCGWLPADWLDSASVERALRHLARQGAGALLDGYGNACGYRPLRQDVQRHLTQLGVGAELDQIVTTHGACHAMDLIARYLLRPGDRVLVDDPGYFHVFGHLQSLGVEIIGVPRTPEGPDTQVLEQLLEAHRPKAFFTTTVLHNPTGTSISHACAHRVLRLAEAFDLAIVEDDAYGDFHPRSTPRLAALDQLQRVIYINSFAKTVTAKLRLGYMAGRSSLMQDLVDLKLLTGVTSSEFNERLVHHILCDGNYRKHLHRLRQRLQEARQRTMVALESCGLTLYTEAEHGPFLWARFPHLDDVAEVASLAAQEDIMLAPGMIFRPHRQPSPWLRFNVAFCDAPPVFEFLRHFGHSTPQSRTPPPRTRDPVHPQVSRKEVSPQAQPKEREMP